MSEQKTTGAADWRSELEKRKSLLRKSVLALFKTWIPDHPEASMARGDVYALMTAANHQFAHAITFVNQLSYGSEDITAHEFAADPISLQELLVQREGTDAFLDPKNALRVVRRKFGMMTLISRMASSLEQRNIASIRVSNQISQEELLNFGKLLSKRIEGTSAEEEEDLRRALRRLNSVNIDVLFHIEVIGRKVPVPWVVKEIYSRLALQQKRTGQISEAELEGFASQHAAKLKAKSIRQLALYRKALKADLGADIIDPFPQLLKAATERLVLGATRNIFDEFNELQRRQKQREALMESGEFRLNEESIAPENIDTDDDFAAQVDNQGGEEQEELVRLGTALNEIRDIMGRAFFARISMVSGDINFVDSATSTDGEGIELGSAMVNPIEALKKARAVSEPFYRCRSLSTVVPLLIRAGRYDDAVNAALDAFQAGRISSADEKVGALSEAARALIEAELPDDASQAVSEALAQAHTERDLIQRSAALVRVASTLIETGTLPIAVKRAVSRSILGPDVHFWGKASVKPPLIESVIALITSREDDSLIFLQKVIVHENSEVRKSVVRTMPIDGAESLERMLLSHLKDRDPGVRLEVIERLGATADLKYAVYLVNLLRKNELELDTEKRSALLNLARLDPTKYYYVYNAMLGKLGVSDPKMLDRLARQKDDYGSQLAALEVLFHLNSREARRILYQANEAASGRIGRAARAIWQLVKTTPYGEPTLPRSSYDPEWTEEDEFDFATTIAQGEKLLKSDEGQGPGVVGFIKGLFGKSQPPGALPPLEPTSQDLIDPIGADESVPMDTQQELPNENDELNEPVSVGEEGDESDLGETPPATETRKPEVGLKIEAMIQRQHRAWTGTVPMSFRIYSADDESELYCEEISDVTITAGRFEVVIGATTCLPNLPQKVLIAMSVDGEPMEPKIEVSNARSVIQG